MSESDHTKSVGGIAPFGYRWHESSLVIDKEEAPVRKLIYELFLKHRRKKTVAKLLNDLGYRTRNDALFSDTTIDRLLRDTTAKGIRMMNGQEIKIDAIIDADVWDRANNILGSGKPAKQAVQLFSGIAFCECGGKMIVPSSSSKYVCINCRHKIPTDDLEDIFVSQLGKVEIESYDLEPANMSEYWRVLTSKEKRLVIEQICDSISIGTHAIEIEFSCDTEFFKTVAFEQQNDQGNEAATNAENRSSETPSVGEPLLSEAEAANFLGISKMTVLRMRNAGEIGFFRVGFRVLYSKEKHLIPFLDRCDGSSVSNPGR